MADVMLRKDERKTVEAQDCAVISSNAGDEDIFTIFLSLKSEEAMLTEQKEHLRVLHGQLETKVKEAVERRKRKVDRLKSDVSDLKRKCEKLVKCIDAETATECCKAAP